MNASLFKDLARSGWHSSIMTTYSVDPAFYDGSIEYRLRTYGCENNILMADAVMLKRALNATPEAFKNAGRRYAVVPVQVAGCFHPKIHLRLGTDGARLVIGSANATAAGWGSNHEIVTAIEWRRQATQTAADALGALIRRSHDYLTHWLQGVAGDAIDFKLRLHRRDSPWLQDLEPNTQPIPLDDGSAIDIFFERGGDDPGMMSQFLSLTEGEKPSRLIVISPYWDTNLGGLREIQQRLHGCETVIALNPTLNEFPIDALGEASPVTFAAIHDGSEGHRFLHAKVIVVQTDKADHILFGSANCSDDAMGGTTIRARNAEVSVYRRFPPGEGFKLLALDLSRTVERSNIRPPEPNIKLFQSGASAVPAGSIEVVEQSLTWWPARGTHAEGAEILVGEEALPTRQVGNGQYRTQLSANPNFPFVVRVRFSDGKISDPIIVHDETALRIASPGVTDRRLRNAFDRILRGEEDIIDLAFQAHLIFETGHGSGSQAGRATKSGEQPKKEREAKDYLTSEEFRDAVSMKPATGESGRFSIDDPGLLDLLAIIFRGVTDVGGREARRRQDQEEDADLQAGEKEDGDELTDDEPLNPAATPPSELEPVQRTFSQAQIDRRKSQLKKAIGGFEKMLENLSAEPSAVSSRLTAQTAFILNLMVFACTKDHHRPEGAPVRLMTLAPGSNSDRELAFAVRAGRILQSIWVGGRNGRLIDRLDLDHRQNPIPDDLFFFIIISRWAITRACLSAMDGAGNDHLGKILQAMAVKIYQASSMYGPLNEEAEYGFIAKLDGSLGFSESETKKLVGDCRRFAATVSGGTMPSSAKAAS